MPMLIIFAIMKALYCRKNQISIRHNPQLPMACLMIEFAAVISLYAGYSNAKSIWKTLLISVAALTCGFIAVHHFRKIHINYSLTFSYIVLTTVSVVGCIIFRLFADYESTKTYNWVNVGSVTLQFSELLKPFMVTAFAIACSNFRKHPRAFLYYYGYQIINVILLGLLQEYGTAMELIFMTCISAMLVLLFPMHLKPFKQHLMRSTFPAIVLTLLCILLKFSKRMLAMADASADERTILGHTVHFWDIRLNSTGEETLKAAESMHNSPLVSANMTSFQSFRTMKPSVITDYVFALMVENFGWLIPSLLIAFFSFVMISITVKHRRKAAEGGFSDAMALGTAILLLVQAAIHILGPFRILPFSGITLPFLSIGLNSLIVCLLLLTTTEDSPDISITKSDTDIETSYFKQVSISNDSEDEDIMFAVNDDFECNRQPDQRAKK